MDDNLSSFEYSHNDHCIYAHYKDKTGSLRVSAKVLNTDLPLPVGDQIRSYVNWQEWRGSSC